METEGDGRRHREEGDESCGRLVSIARQSRASCSLFRLTGCGQVGAVMLVLERWVVVV